MSCSTSARHILSITRANASASPRLSAACVRTCSRTASRELRQTVHASAAAPTTDQVLESGHALPDGMRLEVLSLPAAAAAGGGALPPLVFVHGSYHGAWCWREHFMPYFSAAGYDTYAPSLRGQGGSDRGALQVSGSLASLAADLADFLASLPAPPVLVGHSFGGLLVEKYVSDLESVPGRPPLAGVVLLNAVPPSGNYDIILRITKKDLWLSWKITWAFVGKSFAKSLDACRDTFFSRDIPEADLKRYQAALAACSPVRLLDLAALRKDVPLPRPSSPPPAYVGGGSTDVVVDVPAVEEAAAWLGVRPAVWRDVAHDCMLDTRWEEVAGSLRAWLDATYRA